MWKRTNLLLGVLLIAQFTFVWWADRNFGLEVERRAGRVRQRLVEAGATPEQVNAVVLQTEEMGSSVSRLVNTVASALILLNLVGLIGMYANRRGKFAVGAT